MPDTKQSILMGALVTGILSTSYLSLINLLCCLGVIAGALVAVWHSFGIIQNGGFHSYLCSIGDEALNIARQYEIAGLLNTSKLIIQAHGLWLGYSSTQEPDENDPDKFRRQFENELNRIENEFYRLEVPILEALAKIVRNLSSEDASG